MNQCTSIPHKHHFICESRPKNSAEAVRHRMGWRRSVCAFAMVVLWCTAQPLCADMPAAYPAALSQLFVCEVNNYTAEPDSVGGGGCVAGVSPSPVRFGFENRRYSANASAPTPISSARSITSGPTNGSAAINAKAMSVSASARTRRPALIAPPLRETPRAPIRNDQYRREVAEQQHCGVERECCHGQWYANDRDKQDHRDNRNRH
jgi:hypothetical protein